MFMAGSEGKKTTTREERLAEQLRANLRRRKAAARKQKLSNKDTNPTEVSETKKSE